MEYIVAAISRCGFGRNENNVFTVDGERHAGTSIRPIYCFFRMLVGVSVHQAVQYDLHLLVQWTFAVVPGKMEVKE